MKLNDAIPDKEKRVRDFLDRSIRENIFPGIQYVVLDSDRIVFEFSGGLADIENNISMNAHTTMMAYSMSKTITAALTLQLVERGQLKLDDRITAYVNDIPYGDRITIRHLLCQTSGIPNPIPLRWVHLSEEHASFNEDEALCSVMRDNPKLDFQAGEKYAYSNISYWLLGRIIEKATGEHFADCVRKNIFTPLNISQRETDYTIPDPANHSKGYLAKYSFMNLFKSFFIDQKFVGEYENNWLHIKSHHLNGIAFGGIATSAHSLGAFLQDQLKDHSALFNSDTKKLFYQQQTRNDGGPIDMTLGWHIGSTDNVRFYYKEGGGGGFHSEMRIYASKGIATIVIANDTQFDAGNLLDTLDKEFFR